MKKKITLIPGDGIGLEIMGAAKDIIDASTKNIEWEEVIAGNAAYEKFGSLLPLHTIRSIKRNKVAFKGPTTTPVGEGFKYNNITLRQMFNLLNNLSANIDDDAAIFEPVHGSEPNIAGQNIANPTEAILSGIMMLKYIGEDEAASKIDKALNEVLKNKNLHTKDIGGRLDTDEFKDEIIKRLN